MTCLVEPRFPGGTMAWALRRYVVALALAGLAAAGAVPAAATIIPVTTVTDENAVDGDCSLREAVLAANNNVPVDMCPAGQNDQTDTITIPAGTYTLKLTGSEFQNAAFGDLALLGNTAATDLVITGAGAATTIIQACEVEQKNGNCPAGMGVAERVFHVIDAEVAMSGLTVRHGRDASRGSGILLQGSVGGAAGLTLTECVVTANGIADAGTTRGGGITNLGGTLVLVDSTVADNVARTIGGGIDNFGATAVLSLVASTVSGNVAIGGSGGGFANGQGSTITITNSTISGNDTGFFGGGFFNLGTIALQSSTVTGNRVLAGGQRGGGIYSSALFTIRNTIVAGNTNAANGAYPDCETDGGSALESEGYNLVGNDSGCTIIAATGDVTGTSASPLDAMLSPLQDNGGPTLTHLPLAGSLAIEGGNPAAPGSGGFACPLNDQRNVARSQATVCDIGAVEVEGAAPGLGVSAVRPTRGGNAGTVLATVRGTGFTGGATVTLVRAGSPDIAGSAASVGAGGTAVTTSFDLRGATPGLWSVRIENPDSAVATLADAFTIEAGGASDLWAAIVMPRAFIAGRFRTMYIQFGNRGSVDAHAVPIWLSFPDELEWHIPFPVSAPPSQPGQIATDWTRIAIDGPIPPPEDRDTFPFLLPVVPAGSTGALTFRLRAPLTAAPDRVPFRLQADIGTSHFVPDVSPAVVAEMVARAKEYAATAHGTMSFPPDVAIEQYVRTQLEAVATEGRAFAVANAGGHPPVYSQPQLIIDIGQFLAGESATADASLPGRRWLAHVFGNLLVPPVEAARIIDADCNPTDRWCERVRPDCDDDPDECNPDPPDCEDDPRACDPGLHCDQLVKVDFNDYAVIPCAPEEEIERPLRDSLDPNDKIGPGTPGGYVDGVTPIPYTVFFENISTATGDALEVAITDQLDVEKYDLTTFSLGPIFFGTTFVPVPPGSQSFSTEVDLRPGVNILVGIEAGLDTGTGIVTWKLTTLDPATGEFPEDPEDGFLPPNVTSPEGEGAVLFTVSPKAGLARGTSICNDASIVFDFNAPIVTPEWCNVIGEPEDCENCVDDDGDALVDRADGDCRVPANGAGAGLDGADAAKALDKCAKTIRKVGAKVAATVLKQLQACHKAVADCVQLKPGDTACLTKAAPKCAKAEAGVATAGAKATDAIADACGAPGVAAADLVSTAGLGFAGEVDACAARGVATVGSAADVGDCVRAQHVCGAARTFGAAVPRARELLVQGGWDAASLACLETGASGGGSAIAASKRKALRKCDLAMQKAAARLFAGRTKAGQACGAAVFSCFQTKPGDPSCVTKAGATCRKALAALPKLAGSFASAIGKSCGAAPLTPADLRASEGLGASAFADTCAALGVTSLATVADVGDCLARRVACRADQALENETPRLRELLSAAGAMLP